jgi:hypothetical protein
MRTKPSEDRQRYFALLAQDFLLSGTVQFLTRAGLPRSDIAQKLRALAEAVENGGNGRGARSEELELFYTVGGIAHDWTRSPEYTGRDGEPKPLNFHGRNSLGALIGKRVPPAHVGRALRWMSKRGVIHRRVDGRYVLQQQRTVFVGARDPLYLAWAAAHAIRRLKTALENWKTENPSMRQLDRITRIFDLPEEEVPSFREFAKNRAETCLEEIDNWLEDHRAREGRQRRVEAGVHVYGYVGGPQKGSAPLEATLWAESTPSRPVRSQGGRTLA